MNEQEYFKEQLKCLRNATISNDINTCFEVIKVLNEFFDVPRKPTEIKLAIELLYRESDQKLDIQKVIIKSLNCKDLQKCASELLELTKKLVELFSSYIQYQYSDYIVTKCCLPIINDSRTRADFKKIAVLTIHSIIVYARGDDIKIDELVTRMAAVLNQPVKSGLFSATFELLGLLSKNHHLSFSNATAKLVRDQMISYIQNLFKDDKASVSLQLIAGAIQGLKNHMENFTPTYDEDPQFLIRLYECMKQLSNPDENPNINTDHNRIAFRNMLSLIHLHGHLVSKNLFEDYKRWHNVLENWVNSKSYDDKMKGVEVMQTFHVEIGKELVQRNNPDDQKVLKMFMDYFSKVLHSPDSPPHKISVAIRGYGSMAEACKLLMNSKYLIERFDIIMQRIDYCYDINDKMKRGEALKHLPIFIESLSKIMNYLTEISSIQMQSLESVIVILIKDFHFLSQVQHMTVVIGLFETFLNLEKSGEKNLNDIIDTVIWQGILWTCSHQLTYDLEDNFNNIQDWKETITYRNYLPLWQKLLVPPQTGKKENDERYKRISLLIYECVIKHLFSIIEKLDLSTRKRKFLNESTTEELEFFFTDPGLELEAVRAENYQILYNLVQFYSDLFEHQSVDDLRYYFSDWIQLYIEKSIQYCMKYPFVSAFIYLLEIAVKILERLDFAQNVDMTNEFNVLDPLKHFIKSLFTKCQEMSGELQVAALHLIFQSPIHAILKDFNNELIPVFKLGFSVGKSILSLAQQALSCFEKLIDALSDNPKSKRSMLEEIMPYMEPFLSSKELSNMSDDTKNALVTFNSARQRKNRRFYIQSVETDLMQLKKQIALFLGRRSPEEASLILSNYDQKLVKDYANEIFQLKMHCNDAYMPIIFLDQIMERISKLAQASSNRMTRISACELFHALVLDFMKQNDNSNRESVILWKELCCTLIKLGADEDPIIIQLYEPLLFQMMHYYSNPTRILSPLTTTLIESLMLMISFKNNRVQDLSARLLIEFIVWLFRQTPSNQREISPVRLVDLFQEFKKMSIESDQSRRIGAALAFNNIYRIVREEEALINVYWIYLLDVFCSNFKSSEDFSDSLDTLFVDERRFEQISTSLNHITRVFVERNYIFQTTNTDRIKPNEFSGILLQDVLNWLFIQSASQQYFYRRKCKEMFEKILPKTYGDENCNPFEKFYEENLDVEKILKIGEENNGIVKESKFDIQMYAQTESIFKEAYRWLRKFLTCLDFYVWILEKNILPKDLVQSFLDKTVILSSIEYFLNYDIIQTINADSTQASYETKMNNRNLEKIDMIRSMLVMRIVDLLGKFLEVGNILHFLSSNKNRIVKILGRLIFKPQRLSIEPRTKMILNDYMSRVEKFISILMNKSNIGDVLIQKFQDKMIRYLNYYNQNCNKLFNKRSIFHIDDNKIEGIKFVITKFKKELFQNCSATAYELIMKPFELLLQKLNESIVEYNECDECYVPKFLTPSLRRFACQLMQMCLLNFDNSYLEKVISFCLADYKLTVSSSNTIERGEHFMQIYKKPILNFLTSNYNQTINLLTSHLPNSSLEKRLSIVNILTEINKFIYSHHSSDINLLENIVRNLIEKWPSIYMSLMEIENNLNQVDMVITDFIKHIAMIYPHDLYLINQHFEKFDEWFFNLLKNKENTLDIISKALFLLPCIANANDSTNLNLKSALESLQRNHFPLSNTEFKEGSVEKSRHLSTLKTIFQALLTSKSSTIYRFIIEATINEDDKFPLENLLQKTQKEFMESLNEKEQGFILSQTLDIFLNASYDSMIRLEVVSKYLLTLMKNSHINTMLDFMKQHINQIFNLIVNSKFDVSYESDLINCSGALIIIEAFFASVPYEKIEAATFNFKGNLEKGKDLKSKLLLKARNIRNEVPIRHNNDPYLKELLRKFHCYAYRALMTIVSNSHHERPESIINLALFKETPNKPIWLKMINTDDENLYSNWSQDFEEFPKLKEYIVSVKENKDLIMSHDIQSKRKKYIDNVYIFDRSLSQTLTKSDLSYSVILSKDKIVSQGDGGNNMHQTTMKIALESTPINDHEIMGHLVALINYSYNQKIFVFNDYENLSIDDPNQSSQKPTDKYSFVLSIAESLENPLQPKNVKIFLAKLIENCRSIFSHYAKVLMSPILAILTDGTLGDKLNFFITDLITMLLSWSHVYKPSNIDEKQQAKMLLSFLIKNAYNERIEIFKLNLELIKKLVELWNDILRDNLSFTQLVEMLESEEKIIYGIQLNAVILANELTPWRNEEGRMLYVTAILKTLKKQSLKIYRAGSQLMGMCISMMTKEEEDNEKILEIVFNYLKSLEKDRKKSEIFLEILYGIQKGYPAILDPFMSRITSSIRVAVRKFKCILLEMFLARLEVFRDEELYRTMDSIQIRQLLKQKEYQKLALHIINKSIEKINADDFMRVFNELVNILCFSHPNIETRAIIYEIMINAANRYKANQTNRHRIMSVILKGFSDADQTIRDRILVFLNNNDELPMSYVERFKQLLTVYYDASFENEFLNYATQLLLEISINHPNSAKKDDRNDGEFQEVPIITKSSTQRTLPPIFIQSQQRQLLAGEGSQSMIRDTVNNNMKFTPTQEPSVLTQFPQTFDLKYTQNSLLVENNPQLLLDRRSKIPDTMSLRHNDNHGEIKRDKDSLDYLRHRIVKESSDQKSRYYAAKAINRREFSEMSQKEKLSQLKHGGVPVLYRRYRAGDYPDFYFNSLAILLPLKALVKEDKSLARDIFIAIYNSIVKIFEESNDKEGEIRFYKTINEAIIGIVKSTKESYSFLVSTLIEMSIKSEIYLDIQPNMLINLLPTSGALFLESQLMHLINSGNSLFQRNEDDQLRKRAKIDIEQIKHENWIKLTEYYYQLREFEVISGIFTEKLELESDTKIRLLRAISYESNGKHKDAQNIYQELITTEAYRNQHEKDFYYNSYFNCLADLSDWGSVMEEVQQQLDSYNEIWINDTLFHKNVILPQLMKGELRLALNDNRRMEFIEILEEWLNDESKRSELLKRFPQEIAMFYLIMDEFSLCSLEMEQNFKKLFGEWSSIYMFEEKNRLLQEVRTLSEIYNFSELMTCTDPHLISVRINNIVVDWKTSTPKATDSLIYWNDLIAYRKEFYQKSSRKFNDQRLITAKNSLTDIEMNLLDVAFIQRKSDAAKDLINKLKSTNSNENILRWNLSIAKYDMIIAEHKANTQYLDGIKRMGKSWEKLKNGVLDHQSVNNFQKIKIEALCFSSDIATKLSTLYRKFDINSIPEAINNAFKLLCRGGGELMEVDSEDKVDMVHEFMRYSENSLKSAQIIAQEIYDRDNFDDSLLGNVYFKLGQFYRNVFKNNINQDVQLPLIKAIFRAISYGVNDARFYLPYILLLPDLKNNLITNEFNEELALVPEWMFISNISQILSNFDFAKDCYLDALIHRLSKKYPNALYYPFKLTQDNFQRMHKDEKEKALVAEINSLLSHKIQDDFNSAIQCLVIPEQMLNSHFNYFRQKLSDENVTNESFSKAVKELYHQVFEKNTVFKGSEFSKLKNFHEHIKKLKEYSWNENKLQIKKLLNTLQNSIDSSTKHRQQGRFHGNYIDLGRLSRWFEDFKWRGDSEFIEIPGQYGDRKPFLEHHVKIVRFDQRLKIFFSKQLPVELKILGSDGKVYSFIVKYGEDLRQDQRIQQVLKLMSNKLSLDKNCHKNHLKIETYEVIPVNSFCGMLQIINNAQTIKEFIEEASKNLLNKTFEEINTKIKLDFHNFLLGNEKFESLQKTYENLILKRNREELLARFKQMERLIPIDLMTRALKNLSRTFESYYELRKNFVTSLATMSVAHWLLSIGDRHISNIMINLKKGNLIGIDFGLAFGAPAMLTIPELIPFRLTSHFVNVLEPLGIDGLIKQNMMHALKCFQDNKEIILTCLEVFVKEPTLDWLMQSKAKSIGHIDGSGYLWNPENRIEIVHRKLDGANPINTLIDEMRNGVVSKNAEVFEAYQGIIKGTNDGKRRRLAADNLSIEDQITCLIELATDPTILATTYLGWNGWF